MNEFGFTFVVFTSKDIAWMKNGLDIATHE
jgi:hypothetical protein